MSANTDFPSLVEEIDLTGDTIPAEQVSLSQTVISQKRLSKYISDTESEGEVKAVTSASILKKILSLNKDISYIENRLDRLKREEVEKEDSLEKTRYAIKEDKDLLKDCWRQIKRKHEQLSELKTPKSSDKEIEVVPYAPKKMKRERFFKEEFEN